MAASDKPYHDQNWLDILFALTSIAMLVSVVMMFMQDYFREFKTEQRVFRDVESKLAQRLALQQMPSLDEFEKAAADVENARDALRQAVAPEKYPQVKADLAQAMTDMDENAKGSPEFKAAKAKLDAVQVQLKEIDHAIEAKVRGMKAQAAELLPTREKREVKLLEIKADLESITSFLYIEIEKHGPNSAKAVEYRKQVEALEVRLAQATAERDEVKEKILGIQSQVDAFEKNLTDKLGNLKKLNDRFDAMAKQAQKKEWTWGDTIRSWPIIDGFASPTKIHQVTNTDYGINYNFKDATRFDRCMTCHLGIDRPAYTRENLRELTDVSREQKAKLKEARWLLSDRRAALKGLPDSAQVPDPKSLQLSTVSRDELTDARIEQFCAHPRLNLFVGADSKHPVEKFGCTTCHQGQGSSTTFQWASHTPNNTTQEKQWKKDHGWVHIHLGDWEFPMMPMRFIESSCLKCHHQVTDLITTNNKNEAPKLVRGYNLIRELGCFGCHEIAGRKGGRDVGPDLRLESTPPLVDLSPTEQARIESDLDTRPGNLRKVGPSLYRLAEKSNPAWTVKWLQSPRDFRPDTKMPHFYGLANNHPDVLPEEQKKFPAAEMHAITFYLFESSKQFLNEVQKHQKDTDEARVKDQETLATLLTKPKLDNAEKEAMEQIQRRMRLRQAKVLKDLTGEHKPDAKNGRQMFTERGCLACHSHQATTKAGDGVQALASQADFGPNLSQVGEKLGKSQGDKESALLWLTQWILDPHVHSPRSKMPVTHLTPEQASDIAAWLLAQPATDQSPAWAKLEVPEPEPKALEDLAKVYLTRLLTRSDLNKFFEEQKLEAFVVKDLPADERDFVTNYKAQGERALKHYVGKKAVGRMGCFGCHDIPGFDSAKPIGVGLNDWGKKDGSRLAFEDIMNFVDKHYFPVDSLFDENGKPLGPKTQDGVTRLPFERFFYDALAHHFREGYLNQKLNEPRSYDHNRIRAWDDRSRMPQFRFSRLKRNTGESDVDYSARSHVEEAAARESVMTFVLGLVAEAVPMKVVNQPKGDRLAEVKGRQVLDNFNCAGCHLIRPGYFELKPGEGTLKLFTNLAKAKRPEDHVFLDHINWTGKPQPFNDRLVATGVLPMPLPNPEEADEEELSDPKVFVRLSQAFRFQGDDGKPYDLAASTRLPLKPSEFVYPDPGVFRTPDDLLRFVKSRGQFTGTFADQLVGYLMKKDKKTYKPDPGIGDSSRARPLVPPSLIGQGERTQPEWLYEFLLNPHPVRSMSILRMPKFNMSPKEAQALVDYFGGIERMTNPGIGLSYPYETLPQQNITEDPYFRQKSAEYVARLKATKASGTGDKTMFEKRVAEFTPIWKAVLKDLEDQKSAAQNRLESTVGPLKEAGEREEKAKAAFEEAKKSKGKDLASVEAKYKDAKSALDAAARAKDGWEREVKALDAKIADSSVEQQKQSWMEKEAYLSDAFRLVVNKSLCIQCHSIGNIVTKNEILGPPLTQAHQRLRPGWTQRWIGNPNAFLPYDSSMPNNFARNQPDAFKEYFAGTPDDWVRAARDVLMVFPQASQLPANRYWVLPLPGDVK